MSAEVPSHAMDELEFNGSSSTIQKKIKAMRNNLTETKSREGTSTENDRSDVEDVTTVRVRSKLYQARLR
jgi:hypothetical protein